jgi:ribosomal protein S18 acetylase RimI-like enzyme
MAGDSIEISVKGKWIRVPALDIHGRFITVRGRWVKVAMIHDEWWLQTELEDPEYCVKKLKEQRSRGLHADIFTFTQKTPGSLPKYQYAVEWDSVAAARTSSFKDWWEKLPQESRKNVRRSQKRCVVIRTQEFDDDLIRGISGVNNDSPMRQGVPNAHYGKSFDQVKKDHESFLDRSDFFCAYLESELIGYLKLVYKGDVAAILNLAVKASHNDKRPANALIAAAVERCETRGVSYLTYGLFNYGNKRDSPLREFKSRNGFEEVLTPRFYVPLTTWGMLTMKVKLHRGLLGILPHSVITLGVDARTKWYTIKKSLSRCSSVPERPNRIRQTERSTPPAGSKL